MNIITSITTTPLGPIQITTRDSQLEKIEFVSDSTKPSLDNKHKNIYQALKNYFETSKYCFDLSINLIGTPFQQKVWQALTEIPIGQTLTYKDIAKKLNTSPRAVGNACRRNPIPVVIPCHRVVAQSHLGGYAGKTCGKLMNIKTWLLKHEGYNKIDRATRNR